MVMTSMLSSMLSSMMASWEPNSMAMASMLSSWEPNSMVMARIMPNDDRVMTMRFVFGCRVGLQGRS